MSGAEQLLVLGIAELLCGSCLAWIGFMTLFIGPTTQQKWLANGILLMAGFNLGSALGELHRAVTCW